MKKILVVLFTLFFYISNVKAFTTSIVGVNYIKENSTFTLNLKLANTNDLTAFDAGLSYDSSLLELINYQGLNGWQVAIGTNIAAANFAGMTGSNNIISLTFKAKNEFTVGKSTTISINNPEGSNSQIELQSGNPATFIVSVVNNDLKELYLSNGILSPIFDKNNLKYTATIDNDSTTISATPDVPSSTIKGTGTKTLNYGLNKFEVKVTDKLNNTKTYVINITRNDYRNTDNSLKSLIVSNTSIIFNGSSSYNDTVENDVTSINIEAIPNDFKATVTGTGNKNLKTGLNVFKVIVAAENETTKTYNIVINRKDKIAEEESGKKLSNDNSLSSLFINDVEIDIKNSDNLVHHVNNDVTAANIKYTTTSNLAKATIQGEKTLKIGNNNFSIYVYAENGDLRIYNLNIIRDDNKNNEVKDEIGDNNEKQENSKSDILKIILIAINVLLLSLIAFILIIRSGNRNNQ